MKLINDKGNFTIGDIRTYLITIIRMNLWFKGYNFHKNPKLLNRYSKKINPNFYGKIEVKNPKFLTKEEFRAGKQGYIMGNFIIK